MSSYFRDPDQSYFTPSSKISPRRTQPSSTNTKDTYFSQPYKSPMTSSAYKHSGYDGVSYMPITPKPKFESSLQQNDTPQSATSVISAFRELQSKSKHIEQERSESIRERDELRVRLSEKRRISVNERSRLELEATESLLNQRSINERVKHQLNEVGGRLASEEDIDRSLQRGIAAQRNLISTLQDDVAHNHARMHSLQNAINMQQDELDSIDKRTQNVSRVAETHSPYRNRTQYQLLHESVDGLEHKIEKTDNSTLRGQSKAASLQRYVDLIIKINGELVETLVAREQTRARILRLSGAVGPRYAWPKQVPFTEILGLVNGAALATASGMAEHDAMRTSESAIRSVIRAMSPERKQSTKSVSNGRHSFPIATDVDSEEEEGAEDWLSRLNQRRHSSPGRGSAVNTSTYLDKSVSFRDTQHGDYTTHHSVDNGKRNKKKKKSKKERRSVEDWAASESFHTVGSLHRSRREQTRDTVIARQGAITNATRFAAAVNAAAVTSSVQNTPNRTSRSPSRERWEAAANSTMHSDNVQSETLHKASFIPSGNQGQEFNVVASVSKANRAVKQLNATVASKVKSLHSGGAGDIFDELPRVNLHDMQQSLSAFKKINA